MTTQEFLNTLKPNPKVQDFIDSGLFSIELWVCTAPITRRSIPQYEPGSATTYALEHSLINLTFGNDQTALSRTLQAMGILKA